MTWLDWGVAGFLAAFLFVAAIHRSSGRLLWADELVSYQMFSDPSYGHMLTAWNRGADSGGLFYYLLFPVWRAVFGLNVLSLRLFSTACMSAGMTMLWAGLRRYLSLVPVAFLVGLIFLTPQVMLWQEMNGRFYGLYFAFSAMSALWFLVVAETRRPSRGALCLLALAQAGLIGSHVLGLVYSATLIAGLVAFDLVHRRIRWRVYLATLAGWIVLPISFAALRATSSVATDVFWTRKPGVADFFAALGGYSRFTEMTLATVMGLAVLAFAVRCVRTSPLALLHCLPVAPLFLIASFLLAALALFAKSQGGISIFADRYLLPLLLATAFLLMEALLLLLPRAVVRMPAAWPAAAGAAVVLLPLCVFSWGRDANQALYPRLDYPAKMAAALPYDAPIVTALPIFPLLNREDPTHRYLFLTDWNFAATHKADYSGERLMENWKRAGYLSDQILPCSAIFQRYSHVYLLIEIHLDPWFRARVNPAPGYRVTHVTTLPDWDYTDLYSVERIGPGTLPC